MRILDGREDEGFEKIKRAVLGGGARFVHDAAELDKLSADDRAWLEKQATKPADDEQAKKPAGDEKATKPAAGEPAKKLSRVQAKILAYCKSKMGQQVGNGECWTLADECFKACRLSRPGPDNYVWGRLLNLKKEKPQPGDILQCVKATFKNGATTAPQHTAIVTGLEDGKVLVVHQNWGNSKLVQDFQFDPASLVSGELKFYRPR